MSPREIQARLKQLIMDLETLEPGLANRLRNIWKSLRSIKPGQLMRAEYSPLRCFLAEVILDAEVCRDLLMLASEEDQNLFIESLMPTQRYWYSNLFPKWFRRHDPKFLDWKPRLMAGEPPPGDAEIIRLITDKIDKDRENAEFLQRTIADRSMATDLITSYYQGKPLCVQLTTLAKEWYEDNNKYDNWQNTLQNWGIERGIFISYNPQQDMLIARLVNNMLSSSDQLPSGEYRRVNI